MTQPKVGDIWSAVFKSPGEHALTGLRNVVVLAVNTVDEVSSPCNCGSYDNCSTCGDLVTVIPIVSSEEMETQIDSYINSAGLYVILSDGRLALPTYLNSERACTNLSECIGEAKIGEMEKIRLVLRDHLGLG